MQVKLIACLFAAGTGVASLIASPVTFVQFIQQDGSLQAWTISESGSTTAVIASVPVFISFTGVSGLPFSGPESAFFTLNATTNQTGNCGVFCGPGDSFVQPGYSGTFSFIDTGAAPGANLLSGIFAVTGSPSTTGAQFSSSVGSSGGSFNASSTAGNLGQLVLTSQYLSFTGQTNENISFSLSSLIPNFATSVVTGSQAIPAGTFNASGSGTISSNPGPAVVPEPGTTVVIAGLVGLSLLRARLFSAQKTRPS